MPGTGSGFTPFMTAGMINANIMADQVAMGTFIPGMPPTSFAFAQGGGIQGSIGIGPPTLNTYRMIDLQKIIQSRINADAAAQARIAQYVKEASQNKQIYQTDITKLQTTKNSEITNLQNEIKRIKATTAAQIKKLEQQKTTYYNRLNAEIAAKNKGFKEKEAQIRILNNAISTLNNQIKTKNATLNQNELRIKNQNTLISQLQASEKSKSVTISQLNKKIADYETVIAEQTRIIADINNQISQHEKELALLKQGGQANNQQILLLEQKIVDLNLEIQEQVFTDLGKVIEEKDKLIALRDGKLILFDKISLDLSDLKNVLVGKNREHNVLIQEKAVLTTNNKILQDELSKTVQEKERVLQERNTTIQKHEVEIAELSKTVQEKEIVLQTRNDAIEIHKTEIINTNQELITKNKQLEDNLVKIDLLEKQIESNGEQAVDTLGTDIFNIDTGIGDAGELAYNEFTNQQLALDNAFDWDINLLNKQTDINLPTGPEIRTNRYTLFLENIKPILPWALIIATAAATQL